MDRGRRILICSIAREVNDKGGMMILRRLRKVAATSRLLLLLRKPATAFHPLQARRKCDLMTHHGVGRRHMIKVELFTNQRRRARPRFRNLRHPDNRKTLHLIGVAETINRWWSGEVAAVVIRTKKRTLVCHFRR